MDLHLLLDLHAGSRQTARPAYLPGSMDRKWYDLCKKKTQNPFYPDNHYAEPFPTVSEPALPPGIKIIFFVLDFPVGQRFQRTDIFSRQTGIADIHPGSFFYFPYRINNKQLFCQILFIFLCKSFYNSFFNNSLLLSANIRSVILLNRFSTIFSSCNSGVVLDKNEIHQIINRLANLERDYRLRLDEADSLVNTLKEMTASPNAENSEGIVNKYKPK